MTRAPFLLLVALFVWAFGALALAAWLHLGLWFLPVYVIIFCGVGAIYVWSLDL